MTISNVRTLRTATTVSLVADAKIRPVGGDTIYFTFDKKYESYLYEDASPFAASLLVPCMRFGEPLIIKGPISRTLYDGMHRIMKIMTSWNVGLNPVEIKAESLVDDIAQPDHVAMFFSGGVDSFYTYLKHKKTDTKDHIDRFILVNGYDIDLRNRKLWEVSRQNVQEVADKENLELIAVETNLQELLEPMIPPDFTHGGALAAVALCLRKGIKKVYLGASFTPELQLPWGSHPDTDKFWGTEVLSLEHDGTEASRIDKLRSQVIGSPLALQYLRVCYMNTKGTYNCGECEKCIRTMCNLYVLGKLDEAKTFPHVFNLRKVTYQIATHAAFAPPYQETLEVLKKTGMNPALQEAIEKGLAHQIDIPKTWKDHFFKGVLYFDHRYLRGVLFKIYKRFRHPV